MNNFVKRQLRTTFLLILALVLILGTALYLRWSNSYVEVTQSTSATQEDLAEALIRYKRTTQADAATLRTEGETAQQLELAFTGMTSADIIQGMAQRLAQSGLQPTFYLSTAEAANYGESIEHLLSSGYAIGLWSADMNTSAPEGLVEQLCRTAVLIRSRYSMACSAALTTGTPGADALRAASAVGISTVAVTQHRIDLADCTSAKAAAALLQDIPQGSIVQVHISRTGLNPLDGLTCLLEALNISDPYAPHRDKLASLDDTALPTPMQRVDTTEEAVCFTFSGLGNSQELTLLLDALQAQSATATFFVDHQEAQAYQEDICHLLAAGHELGIKPVQELSTDEIQLLYELSLAQQTLRDLYGCEGTLVRSGLGRPSDALIRAAAAGGYTLISNILAPVQPGDERATDATAVLNATLREGSRSLQRGEIVHFRMNFYQYSDAMLSELVTAYLTQQHSTGAAYRFVPLTVALGLD